MVYVERQRQGEKFFYYLVQTIRYDKTKFKKIRMPIGSTTQAYTKEKEKELLKKYKKQFTKLLHETSPEHLTDFKHEIFWNKKPLFTQDQIKILRSITRQYQSWIKRANKDSIHKSREHFIITHSYDTNRAEGNTFTLQETKRFYEKGIVDVAHKKREIFEIENTFKAFKLIEEYNGELTHQFICSIHRCITRNTLLDEKNEGRLRRKGENVRMLGNPYICPSGGTPVKTLLKETLEKFENDYKKKPYDAIVKFYSAFIAIHPFIDGNGRTSRMLLNWLLMREGLPPINFDSDDHETHCENLNSFANGSDQNALRNYIFDRIIERSSEFN